MTVECLANAGQRGFRNGALFESRHLRGDGGRWRLRLGATFTAWRCQAHLQPIALLCQLKDQLWIF